MKNLIKSIMLLVTRGQREGGQHQAGGRRDTEVDWRRRVTCTMPA